MTQSAPQRLVGVRSSLLGCLLAALTGLGGASRLGAQPTGGQVIAGEATIAAAGMATTVTAGNNAVLRWDSFNVPADRRVQFIQPGTEARVLNWIGGAEPSQINGSLLANGQVYLLNTAGIYFGSTAVVDVGGLYAVGGSLSKEDFFAGVNRFTDLTGEVRNDGQLRGASIALIGRSILNTGSIVAPDGFVGLAAGDQVFLRREGSRILVDAGRTASTPSASANGAGTDGAGVAAVTNRGDIAVGRGQAVLAAGDLYAVAITHDGRISGRDVALEGQAGGEVVVRGAIDATNVEPSGVGGRVTITGERVSLGGTATIDASGAAGGGLIRVGGDFLGANALVRNAETTTIGREVSVRADATRAGDGGRIIVWSDGTTRYEGNLSARGRGDGASGGFAEVSGKQHLVFTGGADLLSSGGARGTLLLDPANITIYSGAPDINGDGTPADDLTLATKDILSTATVFPGLTSLITSGQVQTLLATTDLAFAATNDITVATAVSWNSAFSLTMTAGNAVVLSAAVTNAGTGAITLNAGAGGIAVGAELASGGMVTLNHAGALTQTAGHILAGTLRLQGAGAFGSTLDRIETRASTLQLAKSGGSVIVENQRAAGLTLNGNLAGANLDLRSRIADGSAGATITVSGGDLSAAGITLDGSSISISSPTSTSVGAMSFNAGQDLTLSSALNSAGAVTMTFGGTAAGAFTLGADVTAAGAFTVTGGSNADSITLNTLTLTTAPAIAGGGGTDSVSLPTTANHTFSVSGDNAFAVGSVTFTSIEAVAGGLGSSTVTLSGTTDDTIAVTAANSVTARGIGFSGIATFNAGDGTDAVTLTGLADAFQITGSGTGTGLGISFTGIESVAGALGDDTLTNGIGGAFVVGTTSLGGVAFSGFEFISTSQLTLSGGVDVFTVAGPGAGSIAGQGYVGLTTVDASGGTDAVVLTGGNDTFSVTGTGTGSVAGITFSNIESVDAAGGTADTLSNATGAAFSAGAGSLSGITFSNFEGVSTPLLELSAGADSFTVSGSGAGSSGGVSYTNLTNVNALGGTDAVVLTGGNDTFSVTGTGTGSVAGITFSNIESVDAAGGTTDTFSNATGTVFSAGVGSLTGIAFTNFEVVSTPLLSLTAGADGFVVTGSGAGTHGGVSYSGLTAVDALGGTDGITLTSGADAVVVTGTGALTAQGIAFSNVEGVAGGGGTDSVTLRSSAETVTVDALNAFTTASVVFTGITNVAGGGGSDTVVLTAGNDVITVTGSSAFTNTGINFSAITNVVGNGGVDAVTLPAGNDAITVTGAGAASASGLQFSQIASIDAGGGSNGLTLTALADIFTVTGTRAGSSNGLTFSNLDTVNGGAGSDSVVNSTTLRFTGNGKRIGDMTLSSFESISTPTIQLTAGADAFTQTGVDSGVFDGITFTGLTEVDGLGGSDTVTLTTGLDAITLNGLNAVSVGNISYLGMEGVIGNGGADTLTLTAAAESIQVAGAGALSVAGIDFSGMAAVAGAGGADSVRLTSNADAVSVDGLNNITAAGITFTGIAAVAGNSGADTVTLGAGDDVMVVNGANAVTVSGIAFTEIEGMNAGAGINTVALTSGADTFRVTAAGAGTGAGIGFTGIQGVSGGDGTDTLANGLAATPFTVGDTVLAGINFSGFEIINTARLRLTDLPDTFVVTGSNTGQLTGVTYTGLSEVDGLLGGNALTLTTGADAVTVNGLNAVTAAGIAFLQFQSVEGNGGTDAATLTAGTDIVTVTGLNAFSTSGLTFTAFTAVDAGGGEDTVTLTAGADLMTLTGTKAITSSGLGFSDIEVVNASGGVDTLTLTTGNDAATVLGSNQVTAGSITFTSIEAVAGNTGTDTITLTSAMDTVLVNGSKSATTHGVLFTEVEGFVLGDGTDVVTLTPGSDTVVVNGSKSATTHDLIFTDVEIIVGNGGVDTVTLTPNADVIVVTGLNAFTTSNIAFMQFSSVGGGDGIDEVLLTSADDAVVVTGTGAATAAGVTFSGIEVVDTAGGIDAITLTAADDTISLTDSNQATAAGLIFRNIEAMVGGGGDNRVTLTANADVAQVTGSNAFTAGGISFGDISVVEAGGGSDTLVLPASNDSISVSSPDRITTYGLAFTGIETIDGGGGVNTVMLTGADDMITLGGPRSMLASGMTFLQIDRVDAGGGIDTLVLSDADDILTITSPGSLTASSIAFSNLEVIDGAGGINSLLLSDADETMTIAGLRQLTTGALLFKSIHAVDARGGFDTVVIATPTDTVTLTGFKALTIADITFSQIERLDGTGGISNLVLSGADDDILVTGLKRAIAGGIEFDSLNNVFGRGGNDRVALPSSAGVVQIAGDNSATAAGMSFSEIERLEGTGGGNTLRGSTGSDRWTMTGVNAGTVRGISFTNFSELHSGGSSVDAFTFTGGSADVTGKLLGNGASLRLENSSGSTVTISAAIDAPGLRFGSGASGGFIVTNPANQVATVSGAFGGTLIFRNSGAFTVGTVDGAAGLSVGGDLLLDAQAGLLSLQAAVSAGRNLSLKGAAISQSGVINAGTVTLSGTLDVLATTGAITMTSGATASTQGGALRYEAARGIDLTSLDARTGVVSVVAGEGVNDVNGPDVNLAGAGARVQARLGNIGTSSRGLEVDVTTIAVQNNSGVYLAARNDITVGQVDAVSVNRVGLNGSVTAVTDGALSTPVVGGEFMLSAGGNLMIAAGQGLSANGSVVLETKAGDIQVNAPVASAGGSVSVRAANSIRVNGNVTAAAGRSLEVEAERGDVVMSAAAVALAGGNARLVAGGNVTVGALQGSKVSVVAGGQISSTAAAVAITANDLRLEAVAGIGAIAAPLAIAVNNLEADSTSGSIFLEDRDGLAIGGVGAIAVDRLGFAGATTRTDSDLFGVLAGRAVAITSGGTGPGDLRVNEPVVAGGALTLRSASGGLSLEAGLSAGGNLSVLAAGPLTQNAVVEAGKTDVTAGLQVQTSAGDLLMNSSAIGRVFGGLIVYSAAGNIGLAALESATGRVEINAGGSILDGNGAALNLVADSAQLRASGGSVGSAADSLDTTLGRIVARARDNIYLSESDGLMIGGSPFTAASGTQTVFTGPVVQAEEPGGVYSTGTTLGRAIAITTGSGQITVAPGAVVSTSANRVIPSGTSVLGSGTEIRAGATVAGGIDLVGSMVAGDLRSAGSLQMRGTRVEVDAAGRGLVEVGSGTTVSLQAADVRSFGVDTLINAPVQGVARIEAARDVVIGAAVGGINLSITADVDQVTRLDENAPGGVWVAAGGSISNAGNLSLLGSALGARAGVAAGQSIHVAGAGASGGNGAIVTTGELRLSAHAAAPAGSGLGIVGTAGLGGVVSTGGSVTISPAPAGQILLQGSSPTASLLAASGNVLLNGPVVVGGESRVASTGGGTVSFSGTVNGTSGGTGDLVVATAGVTRFEQTVGASTALGRLMTDTGGLTELNGGRVRTTGAQQYGDEVIFGTNTLIEAGTTATFTRDVRGAADGQQALELSVADLTHFEGSAGVSDGRFSQITLRGSGAIRLDGALVATTGAQNYAGPVWLGGNTTLAGAEVTFSDRVDSAPNRVGNLTVRTEGNVVFAGPVGQVLRLGDLTTTAGSKSRLLSDVAAATVTIGGTVELERTTAQTIETTGRQTFAEKLTLGTDLTLVSSEGNLELSQGVSGAGKNLVLQAAKGEIVSGGDLGTPTARLGSVLIEGRDVVVSNVVAVGDIQLAIASDAGSATGPRNAFLQITGATINSEKGAVVLGTGARTPDNSGDDKTSAPLRSSIFKSNGGDLSLVGNTVTIQPFERLAVRDGSLVILGDAAMTLSNVSASKNIALIAPQIRLRSRGPESLVMTGDTVQDDRGTDLVGARIVFFREGAGDSPTRANLETIDFSNSQGNLLTNLPEVITMLPGVAGTVQNVFVADLTDERAVLRPLVANLVYLDLRTAAGLNDSSFVPPARFGAENETPVFSLIAAGQLRAAVEQAHVPILPQQERTLSTGEAPLAPAVREQLQALGIYARALLPSELESRGRRAGLFVVVPNTERPRESDYEVVDARVEGASVREVLRLAAATGLVGDNGEQLAVVGEALETVYDEFSAATAVDDPRHFRQWIEGRTDSASQRVVQFVQALQTMFSQLERLGLTRQELDLSRAQIYGSILMPRLNADPDFLRGVVEARPPAAAPARASSGSANPVGQ